MNTDCQRTNKKPLISVVSPVYYGEKMISELVRRNIVSLTTITDDFEIILVNDASPDNSWNEIEKECVKDKRVKGINLSRNFGQHNAITAGLRYVKGEWVVVMDCDLQDRPEEIPNLYNKVLQGYDSVFAQRIARCDNLFKRLSSKCFYQLFSYLTETKQDPTVANFGIYHYKVINSILSMKDQIRYFPTMVQWVGFNKAYLPIKHDSRFDGKSSYKFKTLLRLALNNILSFSDKPLRIFVKLGFAISSISVLIGIVYLIRYILGDIIVMGFASMFISLWFIGGVLILLIGILGLYLGKAFEKIKDRPVYIVKNDINV